MPMTDDSALMRLSFDYADAVRLVDAEAWGATWADDAVWILGPDRRVQGRDAIVELWQRSIAKYAAVVQLYLGASFEVDGDTAAGRVQLLELNEVADGTRKILAGYYRDTYRRTPAGWRFTSRELVQHYNGAPDLSAPFPPPPPGLFT